MSKNKRTDRKISIGKDVLEAARERIAWTFDTFPRICLSGPSGKDSGVMMHLTCQEARRRGRKIGVLYIDLEAQYRCTIEYVEQMFALYVEDDAIVLLYKTATSAWSDAPYSWHLQQPGAVPDVSDPGGRAVPFDCWLYDTRDMRKPIAGVRHAVPWEFVRELHRAIAAQSQQPFNKTHYEATIARLAQIECATLAARAITQTQAGGR